MKWIGWTVIILIASGVIFTGGLFSGIFLTGKMQQITEDLAIAQGQCAEELALDEKKLVTFQENEAISKEDYKMLQEHKMHICVAKKLESKGIELEYKIDTQ